MTGSTSRAALPLLAVSAVVVLVTVGAAEGFWLPNLHNGLLAVACAGVGAYVLHQRPGHREGTLLVATGLVEAVLFAGRQVGHGAGSPWWAWWGVWPIVVALALMTLAVLCFPDGRLPSPRWRWAGVAVVAVAAVCATLSALWPVEYSSAGLTTTHPLHAEAPGAVATLWSWLAHPAYVGFQVLWVVAVAARWRSADGHVRRQLTWLVGAAAVSAAALVVGLLGWGTPRPGVLSAALIPLAAGWSVVHGQQRVARTALTWSSRSGSRAEDLPHDFARAVAEAFTARTATLWAVDGEAVRVVGAWPDPDPDSDPAVLGGQRGGHVRTVTSGGGATGALGVAREEAFSLAEERLLDDLAGQAALVLESRRSPAPARRGGADTLDALTPREREVLELLARGLSNAAICEELHLSVKTVEPVVSAIFAKLGLPADARSNRRVLAALAYLND